MINFILPQNVEKVWPQASAELDRAFEQSESDCAENHYPSLVFDNEQLWNIHDKAWALSRVVEGKKGNVLEIVAMAGSGLDLWGAEFFRVIESWAKSKGCKKSIFTGRAGWEKRAPGYKQERITFGKEL